MAEAFNGDRLREVMRNVAAPVTVVTYLGHDGPHGVTIGSFTSVSLDPPLVSFNVSRESSAHDILPKTDRFNIHVLADDQALVASHFALSGLGSLQQFDPVRVDMEDSGLPVLAGVVTILFCRLVDTVQAGDSTIVVAEVESATFPSDATPLLYFQQQYHTVGEAVDHADVETNRGSSSTP